jgi:hypothetical protein
MKERLVQLAGRIQDECLELGRIADRIQEGWQRAQRSQEELPLALPEHTSAPQSEGSYEGKRPY